MKKTELLAAAALAALSAGPAAAQHIEIPDWDNAVRFEMHASQDKVREGDRFQVAVVALILPGYHLYGPKEQKPNRTEIHPVTRAGLRFGEPVFPPALSRELLGLGKYDLYQGEAIFRVPVTLESAPPGKSMGVGVKVQFQICTDTACSPPTSETLEVDLPLAGKEAAVKPVRPDLFKTGKSGT